MTSDIAKTRANYEMRGVVVRCGCGLKEYEPNHNCPKGRTENLLLAYSNKNPLKHYYYNIIIKLQERKRRGST